MISGNVYTYVIGVMKELTIAMVGAVLAFLLSPGLLVKLPKNGSKVTVAAVHALVFGLLFYVLYQPLSTMLAVYEGVEVQQTDTQKVSMKTSGKNVQTSTRANKDCRGKNPPPGCTTK